jgi:UDP-N-acetylmuramyl pentapeptide phosphotransferase/UDP-N-acetylglucosamine-1-phosphate transferase
VNTINFLDGLDGLAGGVSGIAFFVLFFLSLTPTVLQPETAFLCIILAGCALGFLPYNFHPAKIFMGDSGSYFLGFMLAVLAIIAGGKIATALLVLGFPILDAFWVILRRILSFHSPFIADKKHLHHRLLEVGLSQRQAVGLIYFLSLCFGAVALFLQTGKQKSIALLVLGMVMFFLAIILVGITWRKHVRFKTP